MANRACLARLRKEFKSFDPPPFIRASPVENNIQEWRFVLQGPPVCVALPQTCHAAGAFEAQIPACARAQDTPYVGGMYQGKLRFPDDYPFKPPSIYMLTPSGRFETDRRLCLSISDFHPETWVPTWSVATILNGVLSFMLENTSTTGAIQTTDAEKHRLRDVSVAFNARDKTFCELFPELVDGKLFTDPTQPAAPPTSEAPAFHEIRALGPSQPAAAPPAEPDPPGEETAESDAADAIEPGTGKNAAKNKKKKEKEKAKKAAAAADPASDGAAAAAEAPSTDAPVDVA